MTRTGLFALMLVAFVHSVVPASANESEEYSQFDPAAVLQRIRKQHRPIAAADVVNGLIDGVVNSVRRRAPMADYRALYETSLNRLNHLTAVEVATVCVHIHAIMFVVNSDYLTRLEEGACPLAGDTDECRFVDVTINWAIPYRQSALGDPPIFAEMSSYRERIMRCGSFVFYRAMPPPDTIGGQLDALLDRTSKKRIHAWIGM